MDILTLDGLSSLLSSLRSNGYLLIGPTVRDGTIVLDEIESADDLPRGWKDEQEPGEYLLEKRGNDALFSHVVSQDSWKRFLYPPRTCLFSATRSGKTFSVNPGNGASAPAYAFIGVRSCDLHAIALLDKVFRGAYPDPGYVERRSKAFIVAVQCTEPGGTCFCSSMNTGPRATGGFDIALTEIVDEGGHLFLASGGSERGNAMLASLSPRQAEPDEVKRGEALLDEAGGKFSRRMPSGRHRSMTEELFDHPHWDDIAKRCLSCANCTLVCPTCFCSTVEETTDLSGTRAERWRRWDSCFTTEFTKVAGGNIRMSTRTRYRQWLTHKLVHWVDQFDSSGCVGCGRCITWCPAKIDITQEAGAFLEQTVPSTNTQGG